MFEQDPGHNPHRNLWQEVLLRTVEDALVGPAQVKDPATRIRICQQARAYLTRPSADLAQVCTLAGINMAALIERMTLRIAKAPAPEELLTGTRPRRVNITKRTAKAKPLPFKHMTFTIGGITRTAAEWCERTGIKLATARGRINAGWPPERAFTLTRADVRRERRVRVGESYRVAMQRTGQDRRKRAASASTPRYEYNGESLTLSEWSDRTGIGKTTLYDRICLSGWTVEKALTVRPKRKRSAKALRQAKRARQHIRQEENERQVDGDDYFDPHGVSPQLTTKPTVKARDLAIYVGPDPADRGVVPNLRPSLWTGVGRATLDLKNIAFTETSPVKSEVAA